MSENKKKRVVHAHNAEVVYDKRGGAWLRPEVRTGWRNERPGATVGDLAADTTQAGGKIES